MLKFEHIIQVNDPTNEDISPLTRSQLWEGLVLRARRPDKFNNSLSVSIEEFAEDEFERIIEVGETKFYERVMLYPDVSIHTQTLEEYNQIDAESITRLEEPEEGYLFARFSYRREVDEDEKVNVGEHLKSAYLQTDRDAIALIRLLAESGLFGNSIN
ncbi:MAG: AtaL-like protein [Pseudohongiellaceae bacterium]